MRDVVLCELLAVQGRTLYVYVVILSIKVDVADGGNVSGHAVRDIDFREERRRDVVVVST